METSPSTRYLCGSMATPAFPDSSVRQTPVIGHKSDPDIGVWGFNKRQAPVPPTFLSKRASTTTVYREPTSTFFKVGFKRSQRTISRRRGKSGDCHTHLNR